MPRRAGLIARGRALLRRRPPAEPPVLRLDDVRRRLEILLAAVYGRPIPIVAAEPAGPPPSWTARLFPPPRHLRGTAPLPASDAERVHLPPALDASEGEAAALARYRVLAIAQAERLQRGTAVWTPDLNARWNRRLVEAGALSHTDDPARIRDLYLLLESAAVDAAILRAVPGLAPALHAERARALAARPDPDALTPVEREVESLIRRLLSTPPGQAPPELAPGETPAESLRRARRMAAGLARGRYRGVAAVPAWGTVVRMGDPGPLRMDNPFSIQEGGMRGMGFATSGTRTGKNDAEKTRAAAPLARDDVSKGKTADPRGATTMDAPPDSDDDSASSPPGEPPPESKDGAGGDQEGGAGAGTPTAAAPRPAGPGVRTDAAGTPYPEWDHELGRYQRHGALVRTLPPHPGDESWASAVLAAQAALIRRLRARFERMRAQRARLMAQRRGDELDIAACVRAMVDLRTGHAPDDRLYADVRPARRGLGITLLVDVSGSTDEFVGKARIIDVEKVALLLTSEALDALGDVYSILTFSSIGAEDVRIRTVKDFGERNGKAVRARIGALKPEGYTRMGAAIRHATSLLGRTHAGHRLLLMLSDGKPNDRDHYVGAFAVEDARQAIAEARAAGIHPFCLTVDRKASSYLTRIFGPAGHVVLRHPDQLPMALVGVVRQILASG